MRKWLLFAILAAPSAAGAAQERVYLFRGGPVDIQHPTVYEAGRNIKDYLARVSPGAKFASLHNSRAESVVREILAGRENGTIGEVTLIGHSFGVPAAIRVANRLRPHGIRVKRIISVDARQGAWKMRGNTVPGNVDSFVNFYETSSGLPGTPDFTRPDGSRRGIVNKPVEMGGAFRHSRLLGKVVDDKLLTASLTGKNAGGAFDGGGAAAPAKTKAPAVRVPGKPRRESRLRSPKPAKLAPRKTFRSKRVPDPRVARAKERSRAEAKRGYEKAWIFGALIGAIRGWFQGFYS